MNRLLLFSLLIGLASSAESGAFSVGPAPNYEQYESTEIWANNANNRGP